MWGIESKADILHNVKPFEYYLFIENLNLKLGKIKI